MKFVKLTHGKRAMVDDAVYPFVFGLKWYAMKRKRELWHAARVIRLDKGRTVLYLHQLVWYLIHNSPIPQGMQIGHKNRNGLDCRSSNLRIATLQQNNINRGLQLRNASGVIGVRRRNKKWLAHIGVDGKTIHLGSYRDKKDAIAARREAERRYFGEFAGGRGR